MMQRMEEYDLLRPVFHENERYEQFAEWRTVDTIRAAVSTATGKVSELNQILRIESTHTAITRDTAQVGDRFGGYQVNYVIPGRRFNVLYLKRDDPAEAVE